jgi:hypothetical protein
MAQYHHFVFLIRRSYFFGCLSEVVPIKVGQEYLSILVHWLLPVSVFSAGPVSVVFLSAMALVALAYFSPLYPNVPIDMDCTLEKAELFPVRCARRL